MLRTALALAVVSLHAQDFAAIESAALAEMEKLHIPGASIAIVRGDKVVYSKGVGKANIETGEAVRPDMLFRMGSTTKMFTAAALVGLSVEGKLDMNAPIGKYVTGLTPQLAKVTANQLLSHTAGIHDEAPMYGSHDDAALGNGIRAWTDAWFFTAPGKIISYSNPGYWVSGFLVETLAGKPYADALDARIYQPLGMKHSTFRPTLAMTFPLAQGHEYADGQFKIARPAADNASGWPAGSMFSNTVDLARFVIAFLNEGRLDGKQVLDPKTIAQMSAPHAAIPGSAFSYGYGLETGDFRGVRVLVHGGSRMGYGSDIRMVPQERVAVIVQTNRSGATLPETEEKALEMLVTLRPKEASKKTAIAVTAQDLARIAGSYQNGEQRIDVIARDNKLFLKRGRAAETALLKYGDAEFGPEQGGRFIMVAGSNGKTEFIHSGLRSFARIP